MPDHGKEEFWKDKAGMSVQPEEQRVKKSTIINLRNFAMSDQQNNAVKASHLLEQSADPFDKTCMIIRELEVAIDDFAHSVNHSELGQVTMPPFIWEKYRRILKLVGIDESIGR